MIDTGELARYFSSPKRTSALERSPRTPGSVANETLTVFTLGCGGTEIGKYGAVSFVFGVELSLDSSKKLGCPSSQCHGLGLEAFNFNIDIGKI